MAPKFGTSGLRGLVTELTPALVADHTRAFLLACPHGDAVHVGQDLRSSSPALARVVLETVAEAGLTAIDHGVVPTPALALASMSAGQAAIMITGSHIPDDRNGLKFYRPDGEISKADETGILNALGQNLNSAPPGQITQASDTGTAYVDRYRMAFGATALSGLRIGVYEHSSAARDLMGPALQALGAETVSLARADHFIPVDTEAVDPATRAQLAAWCDVHGLDAVVSTDGDADRPMVTNASGQIVPGDVLGPLTAQLLGAEVICTPVSSNTLVDAMGVFHTVTRTRIGSPYVIGAMEAAGAQVKSVGYEANGGFLLGFAAHGPTGALAPLATRDSLLPIIAPLVAAHQAGQSLAALVATLPQRFTAADRIAGIATAASAGFLDRLTKDTADRAAFFASRPAETDLDLTDGLRVTFADDTVIHLRPSGNAPEFRCYAEAATPEQAETLMRTTLESVAATLG